MTIPASAPLRASLLAHPLPSLLQTPDAVRLFMEAHVFAVWDFMSLLKRLQRDLTCVRHPWTPPASAAHARLINEIVLAEESDEDGLGGHVSHFELYLGAMAQAGASTAGIRALVAALREGQSPAHALSRAGAPPHVADFVSATLALAAEGTTEEVAAAFFYGREDIIPEMFRALLDALDAGKHPSDRLRYYLARHIHIDGDAHGPAARALVESLCARDVSVAARAGAAVDASVRARIRLWDGVAASIAVRG
jgi:hypothetical protein